MPNDRPTTPFAPEPGPAGRRVDPRLPSPARASVWRRALGERCPNRHGRPRSRPKFHSCAPSARLGEWRLDSFTRVTRLTHDEARGLLTASLGERYGPLNACLLAEFRTPTRMAHNNRWILTKTTRYCPRCLSGDGAENEQRHGGSWHRSWRLHPVFAYLRHQRPLLYGCPRRGQDITAACAGSLIARASEAGLHPAQCSATAPDTRAICGAGLDGGETDRSSTLPARSPLLRLQHHFDRLLDPDGPKAVGSFGWLAPTAQYFIDLRTLSALIFMTWPRARELADLVVRPCWSTRRQRYGTLSLPSPVLRLPDGAKHHTTTATRRRIRRRARGAGHRRTAEVGP
ncbi:TniQ family protein [Streptomyces noursei]|uniref:TniQ family protein n=1 Tax=Streptomyces noursei TaxID=1971 RepID=UPI0033296A49